ITGTCLQLFGEPDELIQKSCWSNSRKFPNERPVMRTKIYSFLGDSKSSITRLSKRPAPPPSILRRSQLRVICASVLGINSCFSSFQKGTFFPALRPSSNVWSGSGIGVPHSIQQVPLFET